MGHAAAGQFIGQLIVAQLFAYEVVCIRHLIDPFAPPADEARRLKRRVVKIVTPTKNGWIANRSSRRVCPLPCKHFRPAGLALENTQFLCLFAADHLATARFLRKVCELVRVEQLVVELDVFSLLQLLQQRIQFFIRDG